MANDFFNASGTPTQGSQIVSPNIRSEFSAIAAGFDKLPSLSANAYKVVYINAAGSAMDVVGGNGLLKMSTTGVPTVAVAGVDYQAWSANLDEYAAVNPTAAGLALLDDADAAAQRTTLGLVIGTNVQAYSNNLDAYATSAPSAAGLTLVAGATAATQRSILGLGALATVTPGTGVATALAVNVGSAGAPVVNGGALGTPSSGVATNLTGTASGLTAGTVTTNANLTGHVTSVGNAAVLGSFTIAELSAAMSDANISGTNTGDQTITLTGDVTGSGTGSFATTIANDAVTYAKMQNVSATDKLLGRSTAGAGDVEEITCTAAGRALLDDADASAQRTTLGLVIGTNVQAYDADTAKTDVAQTFTASQRGTITTDNDGSFDLNATNNFKCTTAGALALTFTNIVSAAGQSGNIVFINSSNHAITAAANTKVASGTLAAISVTGTYLLGYFCDGTNVYVAATGAMT